MGKIHCSISIYPRGMMLLKNHAILM